jgi:hypothetical protein
MAGHNTRRKVMAAKGKAYQVGNKILVKYANGIRVRLVFHPDCKEVDVIVPLGLTREVIRPILEQHIDTTAFIQLTSVLGIGVIFSQVITDTPIVGVTLRKVA